MLLKQQSRIKLPWSDSLFLSVSLSVFMTQAATFKCLKCLILFSVWLVDFRDLWQADRIRFCCRNILFSNETWNNLLHRHTLWRVCVCVWAGGVPQFLYFLVTIKLLFFSAVCGTLHAWTLPKRCFEFFPLVKLRKRRSLVLKHAVLFTSCELHGYIIGCQQFVLTLIAKN